jgi:hypothetical protein
MPPGAAADVRVSSKLPAEQTLPAQRVDTQFSIGDALWGAAGSPTSLSGKTKQV